MEYTSIDRVLSKFYRDVKNTSISENDLIEWAGEALDFMKVNEMQETAIAFIEVSNHRAALPKGLKMILQVARDTIWTKENCHSTCKTNDVIAACTNSAYPSDVEIFTPVPLDCNGSPLTDYDVAYYRPYFDLKYEHQFFYETGSIGGDRYSPVRLSNNLLFNTLVCRDKRYTDHSCTDEYNVTGTVDRSLVTSFQNGYVAVVYIRTPLDEETGFPLIPDNISTISAITYYIKWKIAEYDMEQHVEGAKPLVQYNEERWLKYVRQSNNYHKMPKTIDQYQNLLEESYHMIPRHKRYYNFFGNLGKSENKKFNDPDNRSNINSYGR